MPTRCGLSRGSLARVGYREFSPPATLHELVECAWVVDGPPEPVRVLPDGCMDLMGMGGRIMVAGPDTAASVSPRDGEPFVGLRFHPGVLPRLLGVPASELRNQRVPIRDLRPVSSPRTLGELAMLLASDEPRQETAPWSLSLLSHVTDALAGGAVADVAGQVGWSSRTMQRQCSAVYGYGPATLRRILRFRRAMRLLDAGLRTWRSRAVRATPTSRICTARSASLPVWHWRRCVRIPTARTDPPNCRPGRRPSRNACPTVRRTVPTARHGLRP